MRDAAGQLADSFDLLRLPKLTLGFREPGLIADAVGNVVDELEMRRRWRRCGRAAY